MKFTDRLKELNIQPETYIKIVKNIASNKGYNANNLTFSKNPNYKLSYTIGDRNVNFGSTPYSDYIIYLKKAEDGLLSDKQAEEHRRRYLSRALKIKGNWKENNTSRNYLAISILWDGKV